MSLCWFVTSNGHVVFPSLSKTKMSESVQFDADPKNNPDLVFFFYFDVGLGLPN